MHAIAKTVTGQPVLLRQDSNGIATLTLNRPQHYNALSLSLLTELQAAVDAIARDESVRVVVIAGAGKAFCAGHDLKEMRAHHDREFIKDVFGRCSRLMLSLTRLPQPVIARNGNPDFVGMHSPEDQFVPTFV